MNYRIEKEEGFRMVGVKERYQWKKEECFQKIPLFWQKMMEEQILGKLCPLMTQKLEAILGVSVALNEQEFDYYIAVATDEKTPTGMIEYMIPACDWAIFECIGAMPKAIQEMQKRIVTEWLPNSGYEYANAPDIEVYFHGDQNSLAYQCEIWFPIKKKN